MTLSEWELQEQRDEDVLSADYHETHHDLPVARYWDEDFYAFVASQYAKGDRILDLGCGPGSLWPYWGRLPSPERLVGVDLSSGMIEQARRRHPDGEFELGRVHELPFPDGSFDLVIASSVLHHVPTDELGRGFEEIARVLDEHGRLVGREPSSAHSLASAGGFFVAAIMNFRHLVFRLTRSREYYPEAHLGVHHHVPEVKHFFRTLAQVMRPTHVESRFPFSSYVLRARSTEVAKVAELLDRKLAHRAGVMFYYSADKNHATARDVERCIQLARAESGETVPDDEFLAYLQAASTELERRLSSDG